MGQTLQFKKMTIGERLRYAMEVRQITQVDLAPKVGVGQSALSNIMTDSSRKPNAFTLIALCDELRISPHWLLYGDGDPYAWAPVTAQDQVELLNIFRALPADAKRSLLATARSLMK
jgi:transcriptional regulator with XRE-family HTH domain